MRGVRNVVCALYIATEDASVGGTEQVATGNATVAEVERAEEPLDAFRIVASCEQMYEQHGILYCPVARRGVQRVEGAPRHPGLAKSRHDKQLAHLSVKLHFNTCGRHTKTHPCVLGTKFEI